MPLTQPVGLHRLSIIAIERDEVLHGENHSYAQTSGSLNNHAGMPWRCYSFAGPCLSQFLQFKTAPVTHGSHYLC